MHHAPETNKNSNISRSDLSCFNTITSRMPMVFQWDQPYYSRLGHITSAHGVSTFRPRFAKSNSPLYMSHRDTESLGDLYCI